MGLKKDYEDIPGTFVFDTERGRMGYHLNSFCISLRLQVNRDAFKQESRSVSGQISDDSGAASGGS